MFTISRIKTSKDGPYTSPIKAKVVVSSPTKTYIKNGEKKSWTDIALADATDVVKTICYDETKLTLMQENQSVMIRNYIKRDNVIVITANSKVSRTSPLTTSAIVSDQARQLIAPPPVASTKQIAEAKKIAVNALVSIQGKVVRIDDVQTRTLRNSESVKVRSLVVKDSSGEVNVTLWRDLTETNLIIGSSYLFTDLKLNVYQQTIQFNSLSRTTVTEVETPAEEISVLVDGFYLNNNNIILVCKTEESEDFMDYTCQPNVLQGIIIDDENPEQVLAGLVPFRATIKLTGNDQVENITMI